MPPSEQQPLLSTDRYGDEEANPNSNEDDNRSSYERWRTKTAEFLESAPLHYTVLTLARISCSNICLCERHVQQMRLIPIGRS